jgi:predicted nucleotidyltransferase
MVCVEPVHEIPSSRLDTRAKQTDRQPVITEKLSSVFVEELANGLRSALGADLVAAYLYGSAVAGGFDVDVSDIDILVVTGAAWVRARMVEWAWLIDEAGRCRQSRGSVGFRDDETRQSAESLLELIAAAIAAGLRP